MEIQKIIERIDFESLLSTQLLDPVIGKKIHIYQNGLFGFEENLLGEDSIAYVKTEGLFNLNIEHYLPSDTEYDDELEEYVTDQGEVVGSIEDVVKRFLSQEDLSADIDYLKELIFCQLES
jgi:hypothetical protein